MEIKLKKEKSSVKLVIFFIQDFWEPFNHVY